MVYAYCRCSSPKSTVENQKFEISNFCRQNSLKVDCWIEETVSGTRDYTKRRLGRVMKKLRPGDLLICSEISRLGRSLYQIMEILNVAMLSEARIWTIKDGFRLGDDIQSKVLAFAFGLSAEIERRLISQRTKEALARKRQEGVRLGRPPGAPNNHPKLDDYTRYILKNIADGKSKASIMRHCHCARGTLNKWIRDTRELFG